VGTSEATLFVATSMPIGIVCSCALFVLRFFVLHFKSVHGERGGKVRLPSIGLGCAVLREVGTSDAVHCHSNAHAVVFRVFPSFFTTTKIVP
jgi:hypothetical protein